MVVPAPRMGEVLPSFLEFLGNAVLVGTTCATTPASSTPPSPAQAGPG